MLSWEGGVWGSGEIGKGWADGISRSFRYTKLGFAGNTEPQFIMPSCKLEIFLVCKLSQ